MTVASAPTPMRGRPSEVVGVVSVRLGPAPGVDDLDRVVAYEEDEAPGAFDVGDALRAGLGERRAVVGAEVEEGGAAVLVDDDQGASRFGDLGRSVRVHDIALGRST